MMQIIIGIITIVFSVLGVTYCIYNKSKRFAFHFSLLFGSIIFISSGMLLSETRDYETVNKEPIKIEINENVKIIK